MKASPQQQQVFCLENISTMIMKYVCMGLFSDEVIIKNIVISIIEIFFK